MALTFCGVRDDDVAGGGERGTGSLNTFHLGCAPGLAALHGQAGDPARALAIYRAAAAKYTAWAEAGLLPTGGGGGGGGSGSGRMRWSPTLAATLALYSEDLMTRPWFGRNATVRAQAAAMAAELLESAVRSTHARLLAQPPH
jgi:hypothetical protein